MPYTSNTTQEREWRIVILALFRAQEGYLRAMKTPGAGEEFIRDAWLRLQGAELRRDDFLLGLRSSRPNLETRRA